MDTPTQFDETMKRLERESMSPFVTQRRYIYIDADLLYDFRLSAVISYVSGEEDYKYVRAQLPAYLQAPTLECAKFFPKLNLTEADIDDRLNDEACADVLAAIAVPTKVLEKLEYIIRLVVTENESKETQLPLIITINQRDHLMHEFLKNRVIGLIKKLDNRITVEFTHYKTWNDVPEITLKKQDIVCVYDTRDFLRQGTTSQKLLETQTGLANCSVMALEVADNADDKDIQQRLSNLEDIMSIMCRKFKFFKKSISGFGGDE